jgi:predicted metal-dependent phosphoesterase TrpH
VRSSRWVAGWLLAVSLILGTLADKPREHSQLMLGGYQVLVADFHIHSFPLSWALLTPFDTLIEARRQGLDVIALTPHNHTWVAKVGQWFSQFTGGPIVLVGEEIHSIYYHTLAVGITNTIDWRQPASRAIDEIHRQGGVAIAAHPVGRFASGYDADALRKLDAAEVVHPIVLTDKVYAAEMRQFLERTRLTAIGDSDYHLGPIAPNLGAIGVCQTYVFARERTAKAVLDALREGRTVVYDRERAYGDPALVKVAAEDGRLPKAALAEHPKTTLAMFSAVMGLLGLIGLAL